MRCRGAEAICILVGVALGGCTSTSDGLGTTDAGLVTGDAGAVDAGNPTADGGVDAGSTGIAQVYAIDYLASNGSVPAVTTDTSLLDCAGLSIGATSPIWIASAAGEVIRSFAPDGMPLSAPIPVMKGASAQRPSGIVFNGERSFFGDVVIVATEGGVIAGLTTAGSLMTRVDQSSSGARYKALAIARTAQGDRIYATNFASGQVEIYDGAYAPVSTCADPSLPSGFAPFNVAVIDGSLYVTFAKRGSGGDPVPGGGAGFVDIFDVQGKLQRQLLAGGALNAPFGIVYSPRDFGRFSDVLLVANVGDERIHAFDPVRGDLLGRLEEPGYQPIHIAGLHDLKFGNDNAGGPHNVLYFSAGTRTSGAFGSLTPTH